MAWNEPGGDDRDPWKGKGGDQGPPDLDEVVKKLQDKMGSLFGGKRGGGADSGNGGGTDKPGKPANIKAIAILIGLVVLVVLAINAFYIIQPAERGVIQRFGAYSTVTQPGPHFLIPLIDKVTVVDVDQVNKFSHRAQMLTQDENIVDVSLTVQYRIQDAADFLFQDSDPIKTIHGAMESALREVVGKNTLDGIITESRSAVAALVKSETQKLLNLYRTGLVVTNISMQEANPPEQVKEAFDDATKALADKERVQNQAEGYANDIVPRARGAGARLVEAAKAYKAKVLAEAEGESNRFLALLTEYQKAPEVTRQRLYVETVQSVLRDSSKVMLDVKDGSNLTYLPLDRMIQPGTRRQTEAVLPGYDSMEIESAARKPASIQSGARDNTRSRRSR
jgi:membrane protease subunit HflK